MIVIVGILIGVIVIVVVEKEREWGTALHEILERRQRVFGGQEASWDLSYEDDN